MNVDGLKSTEIYCNLNRIHQLSLLVVLATVIEADLSCGTANHHVGSHGDAAETSDATPSSRGPSCVSSG